MFIRHVSFGTSQVAAGNPSFGAVAPFGGAGFGGSFGTNQVAAGPSNQDAPFGGAGFGGLFGTNQVAAAPSNQDAPFGGQALAVCSERIKLQVQTVKDPLFSLVQAAEDLISRQHPCSHRTGLWWLSQVEELQETMMFPMAHGKDLILQLLQLQNSIQ